MAKTPKPRRSRKPPKPKPPCPPAGGFGGFAPATAEQADPFLAAIDDLTDRLDVPGWSEPPPFCPVPLVDWTDGTDDPDATQATPGPAGPQSEPDQRAIRPREWPAGLFDDAQDDLPGGLSAQSPRDDRMVARALTAGWNVPPAWIPSLIRRQAQIAAKGKSRDATRAFAALIAATKTDAAIAIQIIDASRRIEADGAGPLIPIESTATNPTPRAVLYLPDNRRDPE